MLLHLKKLFLFFPIIFFSFVTNAQEFGGNPPCVKWKQINTPSARIIFPQKLDSAAERIANIVSHLNSATKNTIGNQQRKINIVLQNQTTISNGYVGLGPYRSEYYLTPLQNSFELGSLPWAEQLALHEFRHVQQYNNFNVGASKLLRILFGEEGQALANNAAIPNWFYEGDAVFNETHASRQGRGRLPYFFNDYRALWQADKKYSWQKLRNGSYKDFVPDHYALGYLMVAYGREKYGDEFWKNVTQDAAAFKGFFYPFQKAIKKYSGKTYAAFQNDALNYFKINLAKKEKIKHADKEFVNEDYPVFINDNEIVFVRAGYKKISTFIVKNDKEEIKVRVKDVSIDNHFSYRNGNIIYAAYQPDIRWGYRDYSEIKLLNIATGKQKTLTHHTKLFSPDISEDGETFVAVEVNTNGKSALQIFDRNGKKLKSIANPGNLFYTYPKFYGSDKIISAVRNSAGQMALASINISSGEAENLTPYSFNVIGFPVIQNDTIYFSAASGDEERVFAFSLKNKKIFALQHEIMKKGWGQYQPSVGATMLAWTTFTAQGFKLQKVKKTDLQWKAVSAQDFANDNFDFAVTAIHKTKANLLATVPHEKFTVKKYNKAFGLINFHSIEPAVDDPDYALTLISQNILNTFQSQLSVGYNRVEKFKKISFSGVYGALFPYLSAGIDYTIDRQGLYRGKRIYWNEIEPNFGISIPLNLSKGRTFTYLNVGSNYVYNQSNFKGLYKDTLGKISYGYINNFLSLSNQTQKARQHIYPRFAQSVNLTYKRAVTHYKGDQIVANGNLYLPGVAATHNIIINAAFLQKDTASQLNFSSGFPFSRGYTGVNLHSMTKWGIDYHFPLVYPELGFASIVYFLRIRANAFYDDTRVSDFLRNRNTFNATFRSAGGEIYFDTKWWNQAPITFGVRYSRLLDADLFGSTGSNRFEFILPVNIFQK